MWFHRGQIALGDGTAGRPKMGGENQRRLGFRAFEFMDDADSKFFSLLGMAPTIL